jgi:hypothetical protein
MKDLHPGGTLVKDGPTRFHSGVGAHGTGSHLDRGRRGIEGCIEDPTTSFDGGVTADRTLCYIKCAVKVVDASTYLGSVLAYDAGPHSH